MNQKVKEEGENIIENINEAEQFYTYEFDNHEIMNCKIVKDKTCSFCDIGYFLEDSTCKKCLDNCLFCKDSFTCKICKDGFKLEIINDNYRCVNKNVKLYF
jgi:hypothetical protein